MNLDSLKPGFVKHGFRVLNLYVDEQDQSIGARFISERHGFLVDLMQIESVPQAFIWVKTPVYDDKGIPHTCEHLLLGKGNRARYVSALEGMSLTTSTAYTAQTMTCYHFNTIAGEETFYTIFFEKMRALLLPDFTDGLLHLVDAEPGGAQDAEPPRLRDGHHQLHRGPGLLPHQARAHPGAQDGVLDPQHLAQLGLQYGPAHLSPPG